MSEREAGGRRELEAAGQGPEERDGGIFRRQPENALWYARGRAIVTLGQRTDAAVHSGSEGGA